MEYRALRFQWMWMAIIGAAVACSQEVPAPRPDEPPAAAAREREFANGSAAVSFTVEPAVFRICETNDGAVSVSVRWRIESDDSGGVAIYVVGREGERKLWLKGGASGESATGRWVFSGTRFLLVDESSGRQLAETQVRGDACV